MRSLKAVSNINRGLLYSNNSIRYALFTPPYERRTPSRNWRLPENDEDIERYLMRWQNVTQNTFLEAMRDRCIKYGTKHMTQKQKDAIKNCVGHPETRTRRALYPKVLELDPTMRDLLLLSDMDWKFAQSKDKEKTETLRKFRTQLCERGTLTYKQLMFAGSLLNDLFGETSTDS
eukprot:86145_1